jgi:hypothetical protein
LKIPQRYVSFGVPWQRALMSQLHLNQIRARLLERYSPHEAALRVEVKDTDRFLSRALAALAIQRLADVGEAEAANSVVDDEGDGGIDALHYSPHNKTLYIAQSKWKNKSDGGIELADILKFCEGIKQLLQSNADYFGGPIRTRWDDYELALIELDSVVISFIHSSEKPLDPKHSEALKKVLDEFNQPTEVATIHNISQAGIHSFLASGVEGDDINESLRLFQWGCIDQPHLAYYGQAAASDLVLLFRKYGQRIFSSNIRQFLGRGGQVNSDICTTASTDPEIFWYFYNGVTIIAKRVKKTAVGGGRRDVGDVICEGLSIVNGAQTVGALSQMAGAAEAALSNVMIPLRIISLEAGGKELGLNITKATNTQNRVDSRNFVALSPLHKRIRRDLLMGGITYVIQQNESDDRGPKLFGVSEAFTAMACALPNIEAAVIAKREVSRLWDNLDSSLHGEMFPENIDAVTVWKNVLVNRVIESVIENTRTLMDTSREKTAMAHANRVISHVVFRLIEAHDVPGKRLALLSSMVAYIVSVQAAEAYPNQYPAVIFKNADTCRELAGPIIQICSQQYAEDPEQFERSVDPA